MIYETGGGNWITGKNVNSGDKIKIVSECTKQDSKFKDTEGNYKTENIAKVRVKGAEESKSMRLNWASIYGLMDAYGNDSKEWIGKILTVKTVDAMVGDKMRTIVYLVPDGYELKKNDEDKMIIAKVGGEEQITKDVENFDKEQEINPDDIPF